MWTIAIWLEAIAAIGFVVWMFFLMLSQIKRDNKATTKSLPKNPNTRPPYSDVYMELEYYIGETLSCCRAAVSSDYINVKLKALDQAKLRARAVLDPATLSDEEWERAVLKTAFQVEGEQRWKDKPVLGG